MLFRTKIIGGYYPLLIKYKLIPPILRLIIDRFSGVYEIALDSILVSVVNPNEAKKEILTLVTEIERFISFKQLLYLESIHIKNINDYFYIIIKGEV